VAGDSGVVETERLLLVPWSDDYLDEFARICGDAEVMRYISRGGPLSREDVGEILGRTRSMWEKDGFAPWAAVEKRTGRWVGRIGLILLADWPGEDKWEVGYELAREFWGRGLATEGARRAIRFGWEQTPLDRIISVTVPDHLASRRVMEECGLSFQSGDPVEGDDRRLVCDRAAARPARSCPRACCSSRQCGTR
jgi:RimJ/RimL family protein N-acetyltransferase